MYQAEVCSWMRCNWLRFHHFHQPGNRHRRHHHPDSRCWNSPSPSAAVPSTHLQHKPCCITRWQALEMNQTLKKLSWQDCQLLEPVHALNHTSSIPRKHQQWVLYVIMTEQENNHALLTVMCTLAESLFHKPFNWAKCLPLFAVGYYGRSMIHFATCISAKFIW